MRHIPKIILLLSIAAFTCADSYGAVKEESCYYDFSRGIPYSFALYDLDNNEPSKTMAAAGFSKGTSWIAANLKDDDNNMAACSTSWYALPGKSNDWMVVAPIAVSSARYELKWRAKAHDSKFPDGYSVYISTIGNTPEDFQEPAVLKIDHEMPEWTTHTVSLKQYEGKTIWVAFVNDSDDCSRLYIDDIFIGPHFDTSFTFDIPNITSANSLIVNGVVTNNGSSTLNGFSASIIYDGGELHYSSEEPLSSGTSASFCFDNQLPVAPESSVVYTASVASENEILYSVEGMVSNFHTNFVVEECTGSWCGYCVAGNVMMEDMLKEYPDRFIPIAVHSNDILEDDTKYYSSLASQFSITGLPTAIFHRTEACHPSGIYNLMSKHFNDPARIKADIHASAPDENGDIEINVAAYALDNIDTDIAISLVMVEDNVVTDRLFQTNGYAGGENGPMGGYENLDNRIPSSEIPFMHVARCIAGYNGIEDSGDKNLKPGDNFDFSYTMHVPESVCQIENISIVALIIDSANRTLLNAEAIHYPPFIGSVVEGTIIDKASRTEVSRFDITGRKLIHPVKGINIVTYSDGTSSKEFIK